MPGLVTFQQLSHLGRLANQIFQITATWSHAKRYGHDYLIPTWPYSKYFQTEFNQADSLPAPTYKYSELRYFHDLIPNTGGCLDICGYFHSLKYWTSIEDIQKLFKPKEEVLADIIKLYPILATHTCVSIHVRRTDYKVNEFLGVLSVEYYKEALKHITDKNVVYLIFGDDLDWARKNLSFLDPVHFIQSEINIYDMFAMSLCKYNITANSTFSWWSSMLNMNIDKQVIMLKNWMLPHCKFDQRELVVPGWTALDPIFGD